MLHKRLAFLRSHSLYLQRPDLALNLLDLELSLYRTPTPVYELEGSDHLFDYTLLTVDPVNANDLCQPFIASTSRKQSSDLYQAQMAMVSGFARLSLVEALIESTNPETWRGQCEGLLVEAQAIFSWTECRLGHTQASLLELRVHREDSPTSRNWEAVKQSFEDMNFVPGLVKLIEFKAAHEVDKLDLRVVSTSPRVCKQSLPLLRRSGNELTFRIKQLHSMTSWLQSPSFILVCERAFHPEGGFQSDRLAFLASRFLTILYRTNNNFPEAYTHAVLGLRYASSRDDPTAQHVATELFLEALGNMTSTMSDPARVEELTNLAGIWDKWIYIKLKMAMIHLRKGDESFRWCDLPFKSIVWLANAVSCNIEENSIQPQTRQLFLTLKASLSLACDLLLLAPQQVRNVYAATVLRALGTATEHIGNPLLALQLYDHARVQCGHMQSQFEAHVLKLQIGRRLDSLLWWARPLFIDFLPICQAYLASAETFFWTEATMQSSYYNGLAASTMHARSYLRCVHYSIEDIDWGEDDDIECLDEDQKANKAKLVGFCGRAEDSVRKGLNGM